MFGVEDIGDALCPAPRRRWTLASWCGKRSLSALLYPWSWSRSPRRSADNSGTVESEEAQPRETLANLSITGHLRCFSDQRVAEIVQCGEPLTSTSSPFVVLGPAPAVASRLASLLANGTESSPGGCIATRFAPREWNRVQPRGCIATRFAPREWNRVWPRRLHRDSLRSSRMEPSPAPAVASRLASLLANGTESSSRSRPAPAVASRLASLLANGTESSPGGCIATRFAPREWNRVQPRRLHRDSLRSSRMEPSPAPAVASRLASLLANGTEFSPGGCASTRYARR